jgi:hypothetical protein
MMVVMMRARERKVKVHKATDLGFVLRAFHRYKEGKVCGSRFLSGRVPKTFRHGVVGIF